MIKVQILAANYGDKTMTTTVQEFKNYYNTNLSRRNWAIFSEDTANPENTQRLRTIDEVQDGQSLVLVPQLQGGSR